MRKQAPFLGIAGFILALIVFLFGDNLCQQIKGSSCFEKSLASPPKGYTLYDNFAGSNSLSRRWQMEDPQQVCDLDTNDRTLQFFCNNKTSENIVTTLRPSGSFSDPTGLAVTAQIDKSGGAVNVVTNWECPADNSKLSYHIEIGVESAKAKEYFPLSGWTQNLLGEAAILPGQAHLFQIEHNQNTVEFFVDGHKMHLNAQPSMSPCYMIKGWVIDFYIWKDNNNVEGSFYQVSTKHP